MDSMEQTVRRMDQKLYEKDKLEYYIFLALFISLSFYAFFSLFQAFYIIAQGYGSAANLIPSLVSFLLAGIFFFIKDNMLLEFDYIVENNTLIFAKIKNLKARKELAVLPISTIKRIEPYTKERFLQLQAKKINCTLNQDVRKYILLAEKSGEQIAIAFEPNLNLLQLLQKELNR